MTSESTPESAFVDRYQVLQLHPRADAAMIDAAYWHLARRYSEALIDDPSNKAKLDELNEAYSIIGSPTRREAYDRDRAAILGVGTLPVPPIQPEYRQPPPLSVMERQKPRARVETPPDPLPSRWRLPRIVLLRWRSFLPAFGAIFLALGAVATSAPLALVAASLALAILSAIVPLAGRRRSDHLAAASAEPPTPAAPPAPAAPAEPPARLLSLLRARRLAPSRDADKRAS